MSALSSTGVYTASSLASVSFGSSAFSRFPTFLNSVPKGQVLLLTGSSLLRSPTAGLDKIKEALGDRLAFVSTTGSHSPIASINSAVEDLQQHGATSIVAFGGGSVIDAAKAISYFYHEKHGTYLPQISIPTTLSAACQTMMAGFTNAKGNKTGVRAIELAPKYVIYAPEFTLATPDWLWLGTGIRAVDHAIEALYRPSSSPITRTLSIAAIRDLFTYLPLSKKDPSNLEVRNMLQIASWQSLGQEVLQTALGLSHALGHNLGATYSIPHGETSCITLAPTIALLAKTPGLLSPFNLQDLHSAVAVLPPSFVPPESKDQHPGLVLSYAVNKLVSELGLSSSLNKRKVPEGDLEGIARKAVRELVGWEESQKPKVEDVVKMLKNECM